MQNKETLNHAELSLRIMELKSEILLQEDELKYRFKEFLFTLNPISIVKDSIHELASDKEVQFDLTKVGLNLGANFLIDQVLGRNRSIKGFLSSVLVEKFSNTFINKNASGIISGISKLLSKNNQ
jgi:hypothetical protein